MAIAYQDTYGQSGANREDLSSMLWDVSPAETPFLGAIGKNRATATSHDWPTDVLKDAAHKAADEGAAASTGKAAARVRLSNYCQIIEDVATATGTQEVVDKGGNIKSELAYQTARRMREFKKHAEFSMIGRVEGKAVGDATPTEREMGSLTSYLVNGFEGGGSGVAPDGNGVAGSYDAGTPRAFTQAIMDAALGNLWVRSGGNENILAVCGKKQRGVISTFTASDTRYVTTDDGRLQASIDVYDGDFHTVTVTPSRQCLATAVFLVDPEYAKVSDLRPIFAKDLAVIGDSVRKQVIWETTLEVCNPDAHANIDALS